MFILNSHPTKMIATGLTNKDKENKGKEKKKKLMVRMQE